MDLPRNLFGDLRDELSLHVYLFDHRFGELAIVYDRPPEGLWAVSAWSRDFDNRRLFDTQEEATTFARRYLREHGPGELVVYGEDGAECERRHVELYEELPLERGSRARPSALAERVAA